jgi:hypothetical protein
LNSIPYIIEVFFIIKPHTISMGFKSGLREDQDRTRIPCCSIQYEIILGV